jgi:ketosteroid isomerase-like protein
VSAANVEFIRRAVEAYNRCAFDEFIEGWAQDAVLDWSRSHGLDARIVRGRDEIRAFFERFAAGFESVRVELVDDPVELEDGLVLAENTAYVRGRDGIEAKARSAWLITFRDGEQSSLTLYQTRDDALQAARRG